MLSKEKVISIMLIEIKLAREVITESLLAAKSVPLKGEITVNLEVNEPIDFMLC
jgi:hypothetical protein